MAIRVTQTAPETLTTGGGSHRVTQVAPEVLTTGGASHRVTQCAVEVLTTVTTVVATGRSFIPSFIG